MDKEKLRYTILNEVHKDNTPLTEVDLGVSETEFDQAVRFLTSEGHLKGVYYAGDRPHIEKIGPSVTNKGEQYLKENSFLD